MEETRESRLGWPKFFGRYDRRSELDALQRGRSLWKRPVSGAKAWATIGSTIIMVVGAVAMKTMDAPSPASVARDSSTWAREFRATATDAQVVQLAGRMTAAEQEIAGLKGEVRLNTYIGCELLRRSQPRALPEFGCSDTEQRARRAGR